MNNSFVANAEMSLEDGINLYETRAAQALAMLNSKGFGTPNPPMMTVQGAGNIPYQGHIPTDLPQLHDDQLGTYLGLLTEWNNYVQTQLAEANVQLAKSNQIVGFVEAKLRIAYEKDDNDKKRSNPERDDYMTSDRRYITASSDVIYWDTLYTHIKAIANSAEQAYAAVSRRITQRGQEIDRGARNGSVNGNSNIPTGPLFGRRG